MTTKTATRYVLPRTDIWPGCLSHALQAALALYRSRGYKETQPLLASVLLSIPLPLAQLLPLPPPVPYRHLYRHPYTYRHLSLYRHPYPPHLLYSYRHPYPYRYRRPYYRHPYRQPYATSPPTVTAT